MLREEAKKGWEMSGGRKTKGTEANWPYSYPGPPFKPEVLSTRTASILYSSHEDKS